MQARLLKIIKDPWNITTACINLVFIIADLDGIFEKFWKFLPFFIGAFVLLLIGLIIHYSRFSKRHDEASHSSGNLPEKMQAPSFHQMKPAPFPDISMSNEATLQGTDSPSSSKNNFFPRVMVSLFVGICVFMLFSFIFLLYKPIHYIVVENNVTQKRADKIIARVNTRLKEKGETGFYAVQRTKSAVKIEKNYLVCINGGYLSRKEAMQDFDYLASLLPEEKKMELRTSQAHPLRKIEYLTSHTKRRLFQIRSSYEQPLK